jgi:hypothetical protein
MKDVSDLTVTQFRFYPAGAIPYKSLRVSSRLKPLVAPFSFSRGYLDPATEEIVFESGSHEDVVIDRVAFSDRRLVLKVLGSSADADRFHGALWSAFMKEATGVDTRPPKPVLFFQETACSVTLDADVLSFLAPSVARFVKKDLLAVTSNDVAVTSLTNLNLRFELSYKAKIDLLDSHKIGLANKCFVLEPLANTPLSERRYFAESPTDSDTHIRLIESFERAVKQS